MTTRSGHVITWAAFALGIVVSIAANILHADLDGSTPAELAGSAFWPLALLLSIEVLTRVVWPTGRRWAAARFGGVGLVAVVAAVLSYRHMAGLLASWGEDPWNAHLGPLAVDGLMLVSATALLAISKAKQTQPAAEPAPVLRVGWRVQLVRLGDLLTTPAVSTDRLVLAYARPIHRQAVVSERIPDPQPADGMPADIPAEPEPAPAPKNRPLGNPRTSTASKSRRQITDRSAGGQSRARAAWDKAPVDAKPSGAELARLAGVDRRTGSRWARAWSEAT